MGRGERESQRAAVSGLLFGPRRERDTTPVGQLRHNIEHQDLANYQWSEIMDLAPQIPSGDEKLTEGLAQAIVAALPDPQRQESELIAYLHQDHGPLLDFLYRGQEEEDRDVLNARLGPTGEANKRAVIGAEAAVSEQALALAREMGGGSQIDEDVARICLRRAARQGANQRFIEDGLAPFCPYKISPQTARQTFENLGPPPSDAELDAAMTNAEASNATRADLGRVAAWLDGQEQLARILHAAEGTSQTHVDCYGDSEGDLRHILSPQTRQQLGKRRLRDRIGMGEEEWPAGPLPLGMRVFSDKHYPNWAAQHYAWAIGVEEGRAHEKIDQFCDVLARLDKRASRYPRGRWSACPQLRPAGQVFGQVGKVGHYDRPR